MTLWRCARVLARSAAEPPPKSRSNTDFGFTSLGSGWVADFQFLGSLGDASAADVRRRLKP